VEVEAYSYWTINLEGDTRGVILCEHYKGSGWERYFSRLYSLSNKKDCNIKEMGNDITGVRYWSLSWCCDLFVWEEELCNNLKELL